MTYQISKNLTCKDLFPLWSLVISALSPGRAKKDLEDMKQFLLNQKTLEALFRQVNNELT